LLVNDDGIPRARAASDGGTDTKPPVAKRRADGAAQQQPGLQEAGRDVQEEIADVPAVQ